MEVNLSARTYFANIIESCSGIDPEKAESLDFEESVHFLKQVWGMCMDWGNQRMNYIGRSTQELECFLRTNFQSRIELHDFHAFSKKLEEFQGSKSVTSESSEEVARTTELLQKFYAVRFKTAALIMRSLCLDCNFFSVDKNMLIPPLDRVNYRMCRQIFGEQYTKKRLGEIEDSFDIHQTNAFGQIGREVFNDIKVLIDNFWFIGHFYHDNGKDCALRQGARIIDFPYLQNVILTTGCPFLKHNCCRI
jgi:hypothetical protein